MKKPKKRIGGFKETRGIAHQAMHFAAIMATKELTETIW